MTFKRILFAGITIYLLSDQVVVAQAGDQSMNSLVGNVGIAAITNEVLDKEKYIEYVDNAIGASWGYDELGIAVVEEGNLNVREEASTSSKIAGAVGYNNGGMIYNICTMGNIERETTSTSAVVAAFVAGTSIGTIYKAQVATSLTNFKAPTIKTFKQSRFFMLTPPYSSLPIAPNAHICSQSLQPRHIDSSILYTPSSQ